MLIAKKFFLSIGQLTKCILMIEDHELTIASLIIHSFKALTKNLKYPPQLNTC